MFVVLKKDITEGNKIIRSKDYLHILYMDLVTSNNLGTSYIVEYLDFVNIPLDVKQEEIEKKLFLLPPKWLSNKKFADNTKTAFIEYGNLNSVIYPFELDHYYNFFEDLTHYLDTQNSSSIYKYQLERLYNHLLPSIVKLINAGMIDKHLKILNREELLDYLDTLNINFTFTNKFLDNVKERILNFEIVGIDDANEYLKQYEKLVINIQQHIIANKDNPSICYNLIDNIKHYNLIYIISNNYKINVNSGILNIVKDITRSSKHPYKELVNILL